MHLDFLNNNWKILAIDDSKLNRAIIKNTLAKLNMTVDEANNGLQGLEAMKKTKYDLILVDIIMPKMDGFGFLEKFHDEVGDDFIPVILMTGSDDLNSKIKGLRIGADDFLLKPLNEKELIARVLSLLRLKNAHTQLYQKNEQIKKELETAKKIQQFIIPKNFDHIAYPKISGKYLPIEDIGGDYFDCYSLENGKLGFLIADVTGHGIPAALVMTMSKMIFSIYAPRYNSTKELLNRVNKEIQPLLLNHQYITSFYTIFNPHKNIISFTNAGHTRALFYRHRKKNILALDTNGLFLGISDQNTYEMKSIKVESGDRLFLYTDGISELTNNKLEEFGESRIALFIKKHSEFQGDYFCNALLHELKAFTSLDERKDDIAFINIEF